MSDIKTITVNGTQYDIKDATARADCSDLKSATEYIDALYVTTNIKENGNYYDSLKRLANNGIATVNGAIVPEVGSAVSQRLYLDFTKNIIARGSTYSLDNNYLYCYDSSDSYLGRLSCKNGRIITDVAGYSTTAYVLFPTHMTDTNVMVAYGTDPTYKPYNPIEGYIEISEYLDGVDAKKIDIDYGSEINYFNSLTILEDTDINSGTGALREYDGYYTSDKIVMDFTQPVVTANIYDYYAYCYKTDDTYLGRLKCVDGVVIADTYPYVGYIRIIGYEGNLNAIVKYGHIAIPADKNPINGYLEKDPLHLRICQYNMGDFSGKDISAGSDEIKADMIEVASYVDADIYGLQYDTEHFGSSGNIYNSILAFKKYYQSQYTAPYNGKGFLSDYQIHNIRRIAYTGLSGEVSHPWFLAGDARIGNRNIKLIAIHTDWRDKYNRVIQLNQIKAYADKFEYAIIIGDFNPDDYVDGVKQSDNLTTETDLAIFKANGEYASANAGYFGDYRTLVHESVQNVVWDGDNILVKTANMTINDARVVYRDWMNDHALLYADITVY